MCHRVGSYHWYYQAWPGKISAQNRRKIWHDGYPLLPHPLACRQEHLHEWRWSGDENLRNLYQQIAFSLNYAAQLRPELMFSVSQLCRVMSCPTQENLSIARQVINTLLVRCIWKSPIVLMTPMINTLKQTKSLWCLRILIGPLLSIIGAVMGAMWSCLQVWLLRTGLSHTNQLCSHQRRPSIMKRPKDAGSWYTSAASWRVSTAPICSPSHHTLTIRPAFLWPKCLYFTRDRNIFRFGFHLRECWSNKMVVLRPIGTRFKGADIGTKALSEPAFVMLRNVLLGITTFSELQDI